MDVSYVGSRGDGCNTIRPTPGVVGGLATASPRIYTQISTLIRTLTLTERMIVPFELVGEKVYYCRDVCMEASKMIDGRIHAQMLVRLSHPSISGDLLLRIWT